MDREDRNRIIQENRGTSEEDMETKEGEKPQMRTRKRIGKGYRK